MTEFGKKTIIFIGYTICYNHLKQSNNILYIKI